MNDRLVARWKSRGKDFRDLLESSGFYHYRGDGASGTLPSMADDSAAMAWMEQGQIPLVRSWAKTLKRVV